ncbi:MAG: YihY/virulence factor BrkB family protein [Ramlibacter sp.]|nr:YihY/virulence factor BrkB family protein [Ramlibacter sp.]
MRGIGSHLPAWLRKLAVPVRPLIRAGQLWRDADGAQMSAAMSFYGILSLAPLLIVMVGILGWWLDRDVLERGMVAQIASVVGEQGGSLIKEALASASKPAEGIIATLIGFTVLLFGATGVFGELQEALQRLWMHGSEPVKKQKWWHTASLRLRGVGYILAFGFMLLVSLVISTLLGHFSGWAGGLLALETLLRVINELIALLVCAALFAALMRISSGPKPRTRFILVGAFVGAILFTIGKQLMTAYLSTAAVVSAYGAAGSLVVLLMWIYFSSAVLLFAAGCARAMEEERKLRPARVSVSGPAPAPAPTQN